MTERITHGRHCTCSACARADWTNPDLAPCGMHGSSCPRKYQPWGLAGEQRRFDPGRDWGHKVRLSVYVEGDQAETQHVADLLLDAIGRCELNSAPGVDFIGCMIEVEHDSPRDQGAGGLR